VIIIYYLLRHCELHVPAWLVCIVEFTGSAFDGISASNKGRLILVQCRLQLVVFVFPNVLRKQVSKKRRIQDEGHMFKKSGLKFLEKAKCLICK